MWTGKLEVLGVGRYIEYEFIGYAIFRAEADRCQGDVWPGQRPRSKGIYSLDGRTSGFAWVVSEWRDRLSLRLRPDSGRSLIVLRESGDWEGCREEGVGRLFETCEWLGRWWLEGLFRGSA